MGESESKKEFPKDKRRFIQEQYEMQLFASGRKVIKILERNEHVRSISQ